MTSALEDAANPRCGVMSYLVGRRLALQVVERADENERGGSMSGALMVAVMMTPGPLGQLTSSCDVSVHGDWRFPPFHATSDTGVGRYTEPRDSSRLLERNADDAPCGLIRVTGVGHPPLHMTGVRARLMARRAAEVRAVRNLASTLGCGGRAVVRGFRYASTAYQADGSVEVVVEYVPRRGECSCAHREVSRRRASTQHTSHTRTRIQTSIRCGPTRFFD